MKNSTTRLITGKFKGRVLQLPGTESARPTRSRIRQAAFNILQGYLDFDGLCVVELCCGSGAWGLEALSRGATKVYLVDAEIAIAQSNVRALGLADDASVHKANAATWLPPQPVDVVLADPPYADAALLAAMLNNAPKLSRSGAFWALETAAETLVPWPDGFRVLVCRRYGASALHVARWG